MHSQDVHVAVLHGASKERCRRDANVEISVFAGYTGEQARRMAVKGVVGSNSQYVCRTHDRNRPSPPSAKTVQYGGENPHHATLRGSICKGLRSPHKRRGLFFAWFVWSEVPAWRPAPCARRAGTLSLSAGPPNPPSTRARR